MKKILLLALALGINYSTSHAFAGAFSMPKGEVAKTAYYSDHIEVVRSCGCGETVCSTLPYKEDQNEEEQILTLKEVLPYIFGVEPRSKDLCSQCVSQSIFIKFYFGSVRDLKFNKDFKLPVIVSYDISNNKVCGVRRIYIPEKIASAETIKWYLGDTLSDKRSCFFNVTSDNFIFFTKFTKGFSGLIDDKNDKVIGISIPVPEDCEIK